MIGEQMNKNCPYCGTKSRNGILCDPDNRVKKYLFFGKCKIEGTHWHNHCVICGKAWINQSIGPGRSFIQWQANVIDEYKGLPIEIIKQKIAEKAFPYAVLLNNFSGDFNIASAMRNANAFGAKEVFYIGNRKFNKIGSVGCYKYMDIKYLSMKELLLLKDKYRFVGVDNIAGANPIDNYAYPHMPLFVFGEESSGIAKEILELCDDLIYIPQFGSIRSINCATASGIIMHDFVSKHAKKQ